MAEELADRPRELLVSGHVIVDRFLHVRAFPDADRTVPVVDQRAVLGGTAANIARVASRLGVATGLVARVGEGFPEEYFAEIRKLGIDARGLERVPGAPTPTCYIVVDEKGAQRTLIDQGAMEHVRHAKLPGGWIKEYGWVHLTTADPVFQLELARLARDSGLRVAADPAQEIHYRWDRRSFRTLLERSEMLFGNRGEIARALEFEGVSRVEKLLDFVPVVIRTEGHRGATAFSRSGSVHVKATRPRRVRTIVGAGDAFRGGFYAAWFAGEPMANCLIAGTRSSARWIEGRR